MGLLDGQLWRRGPLRACELTHPLRAQRKSERRWLEDVPDGEAQPKLVGA